MQLSESLDIVRDFVSKVLVAVVAFLVMASAAIALNLFIWFADSRSLVPPIIVYGLIGLEYVIFVLDMICFGYFLIAESVRFLRSVTALL